MQFKVNTAPPAGLPEAKARDERIKSLLFEAVSLYVEDNEEARNELLGLLSSEPLARVS